jgi:hypothetical protein
MNKISPLPLLASLSLLLSFCFLSVPREALAVLEAVSAAADPVRGEDKVIAVAAIVIAVMPVLAKHTNGYQVSAAPSRDGPRKERHQNDPSNAHLSNNSVYLTTQAWLLDCCIFD